MSSSSFTAKLVLASSLEEVLSQTRAEIIELTNELCGDPKPDGDTVKFLRASILSLREKDNQQTEKENLLIQQQNQGGECEL